MTNRTIPSRISGLLLAAFLLGSASLFAQWNNPANWQYFVSPEEVNELLDEGDFFWLATNNGMIQWNKEQQTGTYFYPHNSALTSSHVSSVTRAPNGTVWIGTYDNMLGLFDGNDWIMEDVPVPTDFNEDPILYDITFGPEGNLYVGTNYGLAVRTDSDWTLYTNEDVPDLFLFDVWQVDADPNNGDLYLQSFEWIKFDGANWTNLSTDDAIIFYGDGHQCLHPDGSAWATNEFSTIARYANDTTYTFDIFDPEIWQPETPNSNVIDLFVRNDETYLVTLNGQLFRYADTYWEKEPSPLLDGLVEYLDGYYQDESGAEWAYQQTSLFALENGNPTETSIAEFGLDAGYARAFGSEPGGDFYLVTTDNQLMTWQPDGSLQAVASPLDEELFTPFVNEMKWTDEPALWLATNAGLFRRQDDTWERWHEELGNFPSWNARSLTFDTDGNPWVVTLDGVYRQEADSWISLHSELGVPLLDYRQIITDAAGDIWLSELTENKAVRVQNGEWTSFDHTNAPWEEDSFITWMLSTTDRGMWIIESYRYLHIYENEAWTSVPLDADLQQYLIAYQGFESSDGRIVFSSNLGVLIFEDEGWELYNADNTEMLADACFLTYEAEDGALWITTNNQGIHRMADFTSTMTQTFQPPVITEPMSIFPNPAGMETQVSLPADLTPGTVQWTLISSTGQTVSAGEWIVHENDRERTLSLAHVPPGSYALVCRTAQQRITQLISVVR